MHTGSKVLGHRKHEMFLNLAPDLKQKETAKSLSLDLLLSNYHSRAGEIRIMVSALCGATDILTVL